ncbi:MAG: ABC transporter permease [Terracidiphilus sp.]|nr:ABC transporter permease [Terracidiphilus sp.]
MTGDVKYALRQLVKSPGFVVTAIVTLALGIGANAVVFSVLNALVLRPLDLPGADRLMMVQRFQYPSQSYPDYKDLRDRNRSFDGLISYDIIGPVGVEMGGASSTAWPYMASGNYFDVLGIQPHLGRVFHAGDEKGYDSAPYVVLSYAYWNSHFHGDAGIVGKSIAINKHPMTVIGVAPKGFRGTELFFAPAFWIPSVDRPMVQGENGMQYRGNHSMMVIGKLRAGVTPDQATADLNAIGAWLGKTYPNDDEGVKFSLAKPGLVGDMLGGPARAFMAGMMALAGLILLAACANLGSLFAARAADRAKEVALRLALGSRRGLILRQLLTEAVLVSIAGGLVGMAGSVVILRALSVWQPIPDVPINVPVNPDFRTYAVALGLALVSGLLFGMVPVRQVLKADPWQVIRTGAATGGLRRFTLRDVLLVGQIAICTVLVTSSLVAVRGLVRSLHASYGFSPDHVLLVTSDLHMAGYDKDRVPQMQRRMIEAAESIPGVTSAGYINQVPLGLGGSDSDVYPDTETSFKPSSAIADAMNYRVSPGYLQSAGTHLLAGRDFSYADDAKAPKVALVNRTFAVKVFGSVEKALGAHFKFWGGSERAEVVGVVEDGKYRSLTEEQQPAMLFSYQQLQDSGTTLVVRSERDTHEVAQALESKLHGLDAGLPFSMITWTEEMNGALFAARVATVALGGLGLLGGMLAATGVFGMASYVVSRRLRELGIRVALGAGRQQVLKTALGRAVRLMAIGSAAGLVLGVLAGRVLAHIVYQATSKDPLVLGGVAATMLLLGLIATWIPARRALAVDPLVLLREE